VEIGFTEKDNFTPLRIVGSDVNGGTVDVDASSSSQFVTALMLIAPYLEQGLEIRLTKKTVSFSYIEMTQKLMREFGVAVEISENKIWVNPGEYQMKPYPIEPDWSSASYWYEVAALSESADIFLEGFLDESVQGDRIVATLFEQLGVSTHFEDKGIRLKSTANVVSSFSYDFTACPDLVPAILATCAGKGVRANITGVEHLRFKESDRLAALQTELQKTGSVLKRKGSTYELLPSTNRLSQTDCVFDSHGDHRLAMALAPLALTSASVKINNPEVVGKSYPGFWEDMDSVGIQPETITTNN
jgi:3-phosphoshikimate 1-carboxyvinyltransferase